ncbi:unnamed protein product [Mytilus edulis]|uniref:Endonuclease/exonuclease/phosphatase domain-containing protein n=1 Tax=Mytilus edulis TaxID=6550 RepID=A0A8S3RT89_MYTED|nr:unnamed protein product [Mytilus edulis]
MLPNKILDENINIVREIKYLSPEAWQTLKVALSPKRDIEQCAIRTFTVRHHWCEKAAWSETDAGNTVQFTGSSCSPDTLVKSVQINRKLEKSPKSDSQCGTSNDAQQDHTGKQFHTAQQLTNIGALRNNSSPILQFQNTHSDNNSIKQPKQTGPKKQKILKQDDLKSKLAVAEAHIAALENTILDNNNLIRNMKLSQLGQTDYHQNGPDHHSYRQTPSSNNANCSNCHCSQLDNRIRDLEREMSNLRLQHLENQFLTLRQQSQNLVNLQGTPHMNQQGPVHTIHSQHVVQPSPTSVQNHWIQPPVHPLFQQSVPAPPPYMFRQPGRTQLAPSQNIIPNSHMQAQHSQMIYPRSAVATQLSPFDSNNSIAVNPSTHLHSQIHHMSSTQGKVQINTSSNKNVPELITKSYVSNDISNSSIGDRKIVLLQRSNIPPGPSYSTPCDKNDVTLGKSSPLRIVSFNIKGFKNYFDELLDKHDIVLIQEHWLFNYEKELLKQHHSDFITFSRQIDDNEPLSPISRPRGHGGIAILYRKSMSTMFSQLPDGDNRIQAIEISITKDPICLINVYLPSRGTDKGHVAFRAALDILKELLLKYQRTHSIIIAGDFNASFHRQYKYTQDELFINFCKDNQIVVTSNCPIDHTYHQGDSKSQIDFILTKPREKDDESTEYMQMKILREGHNTSDHYPVSAEFSVRIQTTQKQHSGDIVTKINWEEVDKANCEQNLKEELEDKTYLNMRTPYGIEQATNQLISGLTNALNLSYPRRKSKFSRKKKISWSPQLAKAVGVSKKAFYLWKKVGSPPSKNNIYNLKRLETKRSVRSIQRQQTADKRIKLHEEIMMASDRDKDLFSTYKNSTVLFFSIHTHP